MSVLQRGRVVPLQDNTVSPQPGAIRHEAKSQGQVVDEVITEAAVRAGHIVAQAESMARTRLAQAEQDMARARTDLEMSAKAEAQKQFVGKCLELATLRQKLLERSQHDVIAVASLLAERILVEQLTIQPQRVTELARQALSQARGARAITLYLAPEYASLLTAEMEKLGADTGKQISVEGNAALGPGDLLIETDVGNVDARISTQVSHLAALIIESINK